MNIRDNLKKGSVEMLILNLLKEKDLYGYEMTKLIKERSNNIISIPEGSMYPTLYKLLENEYISDYKKQVGKRMMRVYYHIEPKGLKHLDYIISEYNLFCSGVSRLLSYEETLTNEE